MPRPPQRTRRPAGALAACAAVLLATGCGADASPATASPTTPAAASPPAPGGHGFVAGAEELDEPALQLTHLDDAGSVHALDLRTGGTTGLAEVGRTDAATSDGRYLFAAGPAGLTVVDTGTWAVDHGDHVHWYRAPARVVGTLEWTGDVRAASSETLTALFSPSTGTGVVLDRTALGRGDVEVLATSTAEPHDGALVPLGSRVVATGPDSVQVREPDGSALPGAGAPCADPRGGTATSVGVVVSCADGAVLATAGDAGVVLERIPYPAPVSAADRATGLAARPGRPVVAAPAGPDGVWLLDTRSRGWQRVPTGGAWTQAVAADDEQDRVVGLTADGRVVVLEPATGALAATEPLLRPEQLADVTLQVDADRAYLARPDRGELVEVDYADGARIARTFPSAVRPQHLAETGR